MTSVHRAQRSNRPLSAAVVVVAAIVALVGCSSSDDAPETAELSLPSSLPVTVPTGAFELAVPRCADLPDPADSLDWVGIQATDFPDPLATLNALTVALGFPYVVDVWGGTGTREGWLVVGVSGGAVELQADIDGQFPGARVLAMPIDWTTTELATLATAVDDVTLELALSRPAVVSMSRGVVRVQLDTITEERVAPLEVFAGERLCLDGEFA